MLHFSKPLDIVLPPYEVPKEIPPVHEVHLVGQEEAQVLTEGGQVPYLLHPSHQVLIGLGMAPRVHPREDHIILIYIVRIVAHQFIVGGVCQRPIHGGALLFFCHQVISLRFILQFTAVGWAVKEGDISVLFPADVAAQGKDVSGSILTHRGVRIGPDKDDSVAAVAHQHHQQGGECGPHHPGSCFPDSCCKQGCHQEKTTEQPGVVGEAQHIGEQQFRPASQLDDTGDDSIKNQCYEQGTGSQGLEASQPGDLRGLSVIDYERHGREAQQAEQVHSNGKSGDVSNENNPPVAPRVIGLTLPLQDEPEHQGREKARKGIDLSFHRREPERVTEGVGQCSYYSTGFNADDL